MVEIIEQVQQDCSADDVRPLTDLVTVREATSKSYSVHATLWLYPGPGDAEVLESEAKKQLCGATIPNED